MSPTQPTIEIVAGAGGAKGPGLIGAFKALEEKNVAVGKLTGVSAGSLVATFSANGYRASELEEILLNEPLRQMIADRFNSPLAWLNPANVVKGLISLEPEFRRLVNDYDLKPLARIVTWNLLTRKAVPFEGDYDLAKALAASCAIPYIMSPVAYKPPRRRSFQPGVSMESAVGMSRRGLLFDGGVHHFHPTEYSNGPAIVFKLGFVSQLPSERPKPIEAVFHLAEMALAPLYDRMSPVGADDIVIPVGPSDLGGLTFSASDDKCRELIENGYQTACRMLDEAIAEGLVPLRAA